MWQSRLIKNVIACIALSSAAILGTASSAHAATCGSASSGDPVISGSCIWDKTDVENFTTIAYEGDWSGNLLPDLILPGETVYVGSFVEDLYDAEAELDLGFVTFFDVPVEAGFITTFEVF